MWFCNCWTGFSQRIGSTERCWLSFEQPSIPPVQHFISVCDLYRLLIHLPALCERIDIQRFSRKDGLLSSCIRLSSAQSLPRSLLSTQKRPVVLRYRLVSRCAVAPRWSAVYLPAALQSRSVDYDGCSPIHEHQERPVWGEEELSVYFTEIGFCLRCLPSWTETDGDLVMVLSKSAAEWPSVRLDRKCVLLQWWSAPMSPLGSCDCQYCA